MKMQISKNVLCVALRACVAVAVFGVSTAAASPPADWAVLAQLPIATEQQIGTWLVGLAAVLVIANQIASFFRGFKEQPPASERYATKAEVQKLERRIELVREEISDDLGEINQKLDHNYQELIKAGEVRATKLHNRINEIIEQMPEKILRLMTMARGGK